MELKYNWDLSLGIILTTIFITLKVTKFISWSWLWIFSPLWISVIIGLIIMIIGIIIIKRF